MSDRITEGTTGNTIRFGDDFIEATRQLREGPALPLAKDQAQAVEALTSRPQQPPQVAL